MPSSGVAVRPSAVLRRKRSLGYQVNHLARLLEAALRVRIAPHGVAPGQFARRSEIWLTQHAGELEATLAACARDANAVATAGVSEADLAVTHRVIRQMIENLTAHDDTSAR